MIGKYKLSVVVSSTGQMDITEEVKNAPRRPYCASTTSVTLPLTKRQALALGLLLIKEAVCTQ